MQIKQSVTITSYSPTLGELQNILELLGRVEGVDPSTKVLIHTNNDDPSVEFSVENEETN